MTFRQSYVGGEVRNGDSHITVSFHDGLEKGVYIAFYQVEFPKASQTE